MGSAGQKVLEIPVKDFQLGNSLGEYRRDMNLAKGLLKAIIQNEPVQFVIADVGHELEIIATNQCLKFWKSEVEKHLAIDLKEFRLEDYPDEYVYVASRWIAECLSPIVLLEKHH